MLKPKIEYFTWLEKKRHVRAGVTVIGQRAYQDTNRFTFYADGEEPVELLITDKNLQALFGYLKWFEKGDWVF